MGTKKGKKQKIIFCELCNQTYDWETDKHHPHSLDLKARMYRTSMQIEARIYQAIKETDVVSVAA